MPIDVAHAFKENIARNGHRLHDMGLSTSRHEDDQLPCRRSRMIDICGRPQPRAACWDRDRKKIERKTCGLGKQLQPSSGRLRRPVYVQLSLSPRGFGSKYEEKKRAGFVADSIRAWSPHRIAGVEGVRLACRLQVEYCNPGNFRKRLIFVLFVTSWNL